MIVDQFIKWVVNATPQRRTKATHALARAYLGSKLSKDDQNAAEAAMTFLLDDPAPAVRLALADALATSPNAPRHIILSLLDDLPQIAVLIIHLSPVLIDSELIDLLSTNGQDIQDAIAKRQPLSAALAGAIAEVGGLSACYFLLSNPNAAMTPYALTRIAERFGGDDTIQQILVDRTDLPIRVRQMIIADISYSLTLEAASRSNMDADRVEEIARDARDRATLTLARDLSDDDLFELIIHLEASEQLTTGLILRAICAGQLAFFIKSLSHLSDLTQDRILAILNDRATRGLRTIYNRAQLPDDAFPAFAIAYDVYVEEGLGQSQHDQYRFSRLMIERILERYREAESSEIDTLMAMLRRFASEMARDAARQYVELQIEAA